MAEYNRYARTYPLNPVLLAIIGGCVFVVTLAALIFAVVSGEALYEKVGLINAASVVLFIGCCLISLYSTKFYFFVLPFIFIAFPAAVNDFFPSVLLGHPDESGAAVFPLITHIDFFIFLGIVKKALISRIRLRCNLLFIIVIILFLLSFIVNLLVANNNQEILLLAAGLFPVRYLILLIVLLSNYDIKAYERELIFSFVASIFFLLVESLINTALTHPKELASGTLGSNTFANITVSILVCFVFVKRKHFQINKLLFLCFVGCAMLIIILTGTRIAIIAGLVTFLILQAYLFNWYKLIPVVIFVGIVAIVVYNNIDVPKRYSYEYLSRKIHFNGLSTNVANIIRVEPSKETSSILTRLRLYRTAVYMLFENPILGTGYGTFNYYKMDYGFPDAVLIDAHNGYLNTLAQLGLSSVFLLYMVYFYPIRNFKQLHNNSFLACLAIINLTMAICDLSNAGIYKSSVFALLAFNAVAISVLKKREVETDADLK